MRRMMLLASMPFRHGIRIATARRQPVGTEHWPSAQCTELHVEDAELGRSSRTHRILNLQSL